MGQHRMHDHRLFLCDAQPACELSPIVVICKRCCHQPTASLSQGIQCGLVLAAEHKNDRTEMDAFRNVQPMQIVQEQWDPIALTTVVHQSRFRIEHGLQTIHQMPCEAVECDTAVVESWQNQLGDKGQKNRLADGATDTAYVTQSCETTGHGSWHMGRHWHVAVDIYPKVTNGLSRLHISAQTRIDVSGMLCCCTGAAHQRTSVLAKLSCRRFDFIQMATLRIHALVRSLRVWVSSGRQNPYICVSSA